MDDDAEVPEDDDPGHATTPADTAGNPSQGCTNYGAPLCDCIAVYGVGIRVDKIHAYGKGTVTWQGRWKVLRNGSLFVRSGIVTFNPAGWTWAKGWTFNDGDILCAGFWTTTGHWLDQQNGPACIEIQA